MTELQSVQIGLEGRLGRHMALEIVDTKFCRYTPSDYLGVGVGMVYLLELSPGTTFDLARPLVEERLRFMRNPLCDDALPKGTRECSYFTIHNGLPYVVGVYFEAKGILREQIGSFRIKGFREVVIPSSVIYDVICTTRSQRASVLPLGSPRRLPEDHQRLLQAFVSKPKRAEA